MGIPVRATERGYYKDKIREESDEFIVDSEDELSAIWMERKDGKKMPGKAQAKVLVKETKKDKPAKKEEVEDMKEPETIAESGGQVRKQTNK